MAAPKGGFYCVVHGCPSKTGEGISLFSIPTDRSRAELWLKAANRYDLLSKHVKLHTNYKMCEKHFEPAYMYKGNTRKRLFQQAHPTIFSHTLQYLKHTDEPLKKVIRLEGITEIDIVQPVAIKNPIDDNHSITDTLMEEFLLTDVNRQEVSSPPRPHTPECFTAETQTPSKLSGGTPRKKKLRLKIKKLRASAKKAYASSKQKEDNKSLKKFFQM
ncbi:uncharacterized protein [Diabrotica undecimpunctata]|uniref:uncharacterized protein n=1 Tax=Diabrotica undecimpunctata TaxID=50387 RepID=UPI003B633AA1